MDTLHYASPAEDDESTAAVDETELGIGATSAVTTPPNVETVFGTENDDTLIAAAGATVLGLGGNDTLTADATGNTLVGCAGENTLSGAAGNDFFGVYNDGANADTITNFTTGADDAVTDEIHLKGFPAGASVTFAGLSGTDPRAATHAAVFVDSVMVVAVTSEDGAIDAVPAAPDDDPPVVGKTKVQAIIDALGKSNSGGHKVVRIVDFTPDKCM